MQIDISFAWKLTTTSTKAELILSEKRLYVHTRPISFDNEKKLSGISPFSIREICKIYSISRPSFYNYLKKKKAEEAASELQK